MKLRSSDTGRKYTAPRCPRGHSADDQKRRKAAGQDLPLFLRRHKIICPNGFLYAKHTIRRKRLQGKRPSASRWSVFPGSVLRCRTRYGMLGRKKTGKTDLRREWQHEASWSMARHHRSVHVAVSIVQAAGDPRLSARRERCVLCERALSRKADQRVYQGCKAEGRRCRQ